MFLIKQYHTGFMNTSIIFISIRNYLNTTYGLVTTYARSESQKNNNSILSPPLLFAKRLTKKSIT